ncbi:type III PLP-dependent enzyme [Pseudobacillus badius]|uniref:type III PLP-dependent enzyme n=1 Tax=Bacillus badius TaxID=1455 RepID=UPI003CEC9F82
MTSIHEYIQQAKLDDDKAFCAFLYDMRALTRHVQHRVSSLPEKCRMFYAIKANSDTPILQALSSIVHGFEVASIGEIRKVRAISADIPILFGGPGKTDEEIHAAIEQKISLLHVESLHELRRASYIAKQKGAILPILLRVNLHSPLPEATLAMGGRPTQFGIDERNIGEAIKLAVALEGVRLEGFHLHSLSNNLDAFQHAQLVKNYCQKVKEWVEEFNLTISYLNAGGGIGVNYQQLDQQFNWELFIDQLKPVLASHQLGDIDIIFECGRYLTAGCGYYAAEVLDIKQNHGKNYVIIKGGTHHFRLPVSWQHSHPFEIIHMDQWNNPFARIELTDSEITIAGQLCTPKDVLAKDCRVARVRIGDIVLFRYTGAYGWAISHHDFLSHPHPDHFYIGTLDETAAGLKKELIAFNE